VAEPRRRGLRGAVVALALAAACGTASEDRGPPTTTSTTAATPAPMVHDHTPHHGGVVGMAGDMHLEALAAADGRIALWLTDVARRPLSLAGVEGTVTLELPEGDRTLPLALAGDHLAAAGPTPAGEEVVARFALRVGGAPVEMDFSLALADERLGAAGVPVGGCRPVPSGSGTGRAPSCSLDFGAAVTALAATPDGTTLLVAAVDRGVSAWRMPEGRLAGGFAPPPPIVVPGGEAAARHPEAATALVVSPDGTAAVMAIEARLLRHAVASGRLVRELPAPRGILRHLAWSPDGDTLLVTAFYDAVAHRLAAEDGGARGALGVEREAAAAAFAADGRRAAVGSDLGPITVFELPAERPLHVLAAGRSTALDLAFAGERLLAASGDGVLRAWEADGRPAWETPTGTRFLHLALDRGGALVATGGRDGSLALYDVTRGTRLETLAFHASPILALAWAGPVLVSGDATGRVAFWDLRDLSRGGLPAGSGSAP
jgi:WD40 repeat protein